ncbi:MAG: hypothetical protein EHM58_09940 [Ignavibacteriae bacterium]|nr:MAG: hypothetical protein EHM58_09940 [Ignavibacteriota bacterium]
MKIKQTINITGIFLLIVMGFLFLHSELNFFMPEEHAHTSHDICEIINSAKTENNNLNNSKVLSFDLFNDFLTIPKILSADITKAIVNPQKTETCIKLNILNNSFLI